HADPRRDRPRGSDITGEQHVEHVTGAADPLQVGHEVLLDERHDLLGPPPARERHAVGVDLAAEVDLERRRVAPAGSGKLDSSVRMSTRRPHRGYGTSATWCSVSA